MNTIIKKIKAVSIVWIIISSMILTAYASSYWTSYSFSVSTTWPTRNFNGTNITFISPNATSTPYIHPLNFTYNVSLYRDKLIDDFIGWSTLYRDNSGSVTWSNVWSWDYYVILTKANDGITLVDNSVTIKN